VKKVFRIYAAGDRGSDARDDDMSEREFTRFCTEAKLLDEHTCTSVAVTQLFYKVQEVDESAQLKGVRFTAFLEMLCALAFMKKPSPFVAPHHKLRSFLEEFVIPLAKAKKER